MSTVQNTTAYSNNTVRLLIKDIETGRTQVRAGLNQKTVSDYAKTMAELKGRKAAGESIDPGEEFLPVVIFFDGEYYYLADGFHRVAAAEQNFETHIDCQLETGSYAEALKYAFAANAGRRGLYMSNADKRASVKKAIESGLANGMSDRDLSKLCFVSNWLVSDVRRELKEGLLESSSQSPDDSAMVDAEHELVLSDSNNTDPMAAQAPKLTPSNRKPPATASAKLSDSDGKQAEPAKPIKSGIEIGVPIPHIKEAATAYGALTRATDRVARHPHCRIDAKSLRCDEEFETFYERLLSANGPVERVDGSWVLLDADEGGLAAATIWQIEHVKAVRANQSGDDEPEESEADDDDQTGPSADNAILPDAIPDDDDPIPC